MKREEELTVSVKPLEWRDVPVPPSGETLASSPVGLYCIPHSGDRFYLRFRDEVTLGDYSTLDRAKAAAQSHFDDAIRSCILPTPKPAWPIDSDDQVEDLARECEWDNRKYMTQEDYGIWCERMRKFARLAATPKPVGWETDAEWELEMRCCNITEATPFAEVSKLINDLWQQYCLAAEPKGVDHQVHHSKPVVSQNTQIVEDNGAHANLPDTCDGKEQYAFEAWATSEGFDMHEHPIHYLFMDKRTDAARQAWKAAIMYCRAALTEKQTD